MRKSKNAKLAKAKCDKLFSQYIRNRDSDNGIAECITCGKVTAQFDCGHFISRRFESTRYDERNSNAQCLRCNRFENGNQFEHGVKIDQKYSEGTALELLHLSKQTTRRKHWDYEILAEELRGKLKLIREVVG